MRRISDEINAFAQTDDFKEQVFSGKLNTKDNGRITQTRKYRLITPLFGGGVEPKTPDPIKVIRETSIRGQLRFWWRAMRGVGTLQQMKKREDAIFGSGGNDAAQSKLWIAIRVGEDGKIDGEGSPATPFYMNERNYPRAETGWEILAYALFPLQPTSEEVKRGEHLPMKQVRLRVEFTLEVSFPKDVRQEIEAALWAWETFGGLGGRTRRGFGSLELVELKEDKLEQPIVKPPSIDADRFLRNKISELTNDLPEKRQNDVTHVLPASEMKTKQFDNGLSACEFLIRKLRDFRQARRMRTDPNGKQKQSISFWPEPDAIRRIVRKSDKNTSNFAHPQNPDFDRVQRFPRAEFGLPIVFHFPQNNEPSKTELRPNELTRLASPLILKPVACSDGKVVALALILETPKHILDDVHLFNQTTKKDYGIVAVHLRLGDEKHIKPMESFDEPDVLKSFLKTI